MKSIFSMESKDEARLLKRALKVKTERGMRKVLEEAYEAGRERGREEVDDGRWEYRW